MAKKPKKITASLAEQAYARTILSWLHNHYSRKIKSDDPYLIYAITAWLHAADKEWPNRLRKNNPFGVLDPTGHLMKFQSVTAGIIGAAKMLVAQTRNNAKYVIDPVTGRRKMLKANTHREIELFEGALNALKHGGDAGAQGFLQWLAYTSWSPSHYGWKPGEDVARPESNKLIWWYYRFGGMETVTQQPKKTRVIPAPPRDLNSPIIVRDYIDPWAIKGFYEARHPEWPILPGVDDSMQG